MKPYLLLLGLLAAGCQKTGDATPEATGAAEEFEVETQAATATAG